MTSIAWSALGIQLLTVNCAAEVPAVWQAVPAKARPAAAALRFEKVSDHVYFLQARDEGVNSAAILSSEGFLVINPPGEPGLQPVLDALRQIAARPVRWVVSTDYLLERVGGGTILQGRGAALIASRELSDLSSLSPPAIQADKGAAEDTPADVGPRLVFTRQMRLFPDNLEIRIIAVQQGARTGGDVVVFVPTEKVLITGRMFASESFPQIDEDAGGRASGWIDGLKQVIDVVPLLKSAMPPPKPDPNKPPPEEKTLEEQVTVIPGQGPRANLQEMKDLLEAASKLRSEITRAIGAGRSRESTLNFSALGPARSLDNFEPFAGMLFDEIAAKKVK